jgi:Alkylmercury lyase
MPGNAPAWPPAPAPSTRRCCAAPPPPGGPPGPAELEQTARRHGITAGQALATLAADDVLGLDDHGRIRMAYPFSAAPTAHVVAIGGGPRVHAMCAIDALGCCAALKMPTKAAFTMPMGIRVKSGGVVGEVSAHIGEVP